MRVRSFLIGVAFVYLIFSILSVVYGSFGYRAIAALIGCSVLLYMTIKADTNGLRLRQMLVFVVLVIFTFSIFSFQSTEGRSLFAVLVFLGALGICWFSIASYSTFYLYELPFYFILGGTLLLFLGFGYGPAEFNTFLSGYSRNGYSAILLAFAGGYIFSRVYRDKKISLLLLVLVFVSSFPLYGRSGIAMAFALVLAVLCHKSIKLAVLFGLCGAVGAIFSLDGVENYIYGATNFSSGIESPRSEMLEQYANALDVVGLFFGVDVGRVPIILEYGKNPHNAFVLLHSYYGLAMFPLLCLFAVSLLKLFVGGQYMFLVVALLFLIRAFFDIIYLFGLFDYLLFPLLFYAVFANYFRSESYLVSSLEERL